MGVLRRLRLMMWLSPRTFRTGFLGERRQPGQGFLHLFQRGHQMINLILKIHGEIKQLSHSAA
jgi:hypothetical protein